MCLVYSSFILEVPLEFVEVLSVMEDSCSLAEVEVAYVPFRISDLLI